VTRELSLITVRFRATMPIMDGFFLFIKELQNAQKNQLKQAYYCRYR
jgi:hypothetical protein